MGSRGGFKNSTTLRPEQLQGMGVSSKDMPNSSAAPPPTFPTLISRYSFSSFRNAIILVQQISFLRFFQAGDAGSKSTQNPRKYSKQFDIIPAVVWLQKSPQREYMISWKYNFLHFLKESPYYLSSNSGPKYSRNRNLADASVSLGWTSTLDRSSTISVPIGHERASFHFHVAAYASGAPAELEAKGSQLRGAKEEDENGERRRDPESTRAKGEELQVKHRGRHQGLSQQRQREWEGLIFAQQNGADSTNRMRFCRKTSRTRNTTRKWMKTMTTGSATSTMATITTTKMITWTMGRSISHSHPV